MFLGIDGYRAGWVAAFINNNNKINISIYKNIIELCCLVLAISAKLAFKSGNISKIPKAEQIDSKGFIMQISYFLKPCF